MVEAVLGVEDGAAVIGWAGLLALQSGAQVTWIVQLAEMWTALAPWSQATAERLWQQTRSASGWHSRLIEAVLAQPQVAEKWGRELHAGQDLPEWAWRAMGRSGQFTAATLVQKVKLVYPHANSADSYARVRAGTMALAQLGAADAGRHLPRWLAEEAHAYPDRAPRWEDCVRDELQEWMGNTADLWGGASWLLLHATAETAAFWRGYLRGACAATGAEGARTLAQLAVREGQQWSRAIWEEACNLWRRYGDERVMPLLAQLWQLLDPREANIGAPAAAEENHIRRLYLEAALWGSEGRRGLLGRQPTAWIVRWLETTCPPALRHGVTVNILQWRYDAAVARLGNTWQRRAQETRNASLQQLALYLLPAIEPAVLQAYLDDADCQVGAGAGGESSAAFRPPDEDPLGQLQCPRGKYSPQYRTG